MQARVSAVSDQRGGHWQTLLGSAGRHVSDDKRGKLVPSAENIMQLVPNAGKHHLIDKLQRWTEMVDFGSNVPCVLFARST